MTTEEALTKKILSLEDLVAYETASIPIIIHLLCCLSASYKRFVSARISRRVIRKLKLYKELKEKLK